MTHYRIWSFNTGIGKRYSVGQFNGSEMIGDIKQDYKTKKAALKKLKSIMNRRL